MEKIKIEFTAKIIRITDGFNAVLEDGYLIKFRDNKQHYFKINDNIQITIQNIETAKNDLITLNQSIIYGIITSFISNGFLFKEVTKREGFFWAQTRGMLTHKIFEKNDLFAVNTLIQISIRHLDI